MLDIVIKPRAKRLPRPFRFHQRVLFLDGRFELPGMQLYRMRATILIDPDSGAGEGSIYWHKLRLDASPTSSFGTEQVRGAIQNRNVDLVGWHADPGLLTDVYRIVLVTGAKSGRFDGTTRAFGTWSGRVAGAYRFVDR